MRNQTSCMHVGTFHSSCIPWALQRYVNGMHSNTAFLSFSNWKYNFFVGLCMYHTCMYVNGLISQWPTCEISDGSRKMCVFFFTKLSRPWRKTHFLSTFFFFYFYKNETLFTLLMLSMYTFTFIEIMIWKLTAWAPCRTDNKCNWEWTAYWLSNYEWTIKWISFVIKSHKCCSSPNMVGESSANSLHTSLSLIQNERWAYYRIERWRARIEIASQMLIAHTRLCTHTSNISVIPYCNVRLYARAFVQEKFKIVHTT